MANIFDYLSWRGDLSWKADPFNEADSLIFCMIAYLEFGGIVPSPAEKGYITLKEAAKRFLIMAEGKGEINTGLLISGDTVGLLYEAGNLPRYEEVRLSGYVNSIDLNEEKQFSALTFSWGTGNHYIAFRGTDDTLVGWKEDLNMSFLETVPSQNEALRYLEKTAKAFFGNIYLGGHSKGGNLAVYAAMNVAPRIQKRIKAIYNNDGPGFRKAVIENKKYLNISHKVYTAVPQSSIIGMLLEHEEDYRVIHSKQTGIMQHDPFSWEVKGNRFVYLEEITEQSHFIDKTLKDWISQMNREQREKFSDALYQILTATKATTLTELSTKRAGLFIKNLRESDEQTKKIIYHTIQLLIKTATHNFAAVNSKNKL